MLAISNVNYVNMHRMGEPQRKRMKTTLSEWSSEKWARFREAYKRYEFLWKEDILGYKDESEKADLYKALAEEMEDTGKIDSRHLA